MPVKSKLKLKLLPGDSPRLHRKVFAELGRYNHDCVGDAHWKPIAIEIRDASGRVQGGLLGGSFWGWLDIRLLWVDKKFRGQGLGRQLMKRAEALGRRRGRKHATLCTTSFQAPDFYKALGYKAFGVLKDFPKGHTRYWMNKKL